VYLDGVEGGDGVCEGGGVLAEGLYHHCPALITSHPPTLQGLQQRQGLRTTTTLLIHTATQHVS
jgi:hypothetical protein